MNLSRQLIAFACFLLFQPNVQSQELSILTWNIQHLGKTKNATEIAFMVKVMKAYDIIAIQEVVAKDPAGIKAVVRIVEQLNRSGAKWYRIHRLPPGAAQGATEHRVAANF